MSEETVELSGQDKDECVWCDRVFGLFGIGMGLVFLYIGLDVLLGSRISTILSGGKDETDA